MNLELAFQQAAVTPPRKSKLDTIWEGMSTADQVALDNALRSTLTSVDIARVLTAQGYVIGDATIRRHRERMDSEVTGL